MKQFYFTYHVKMASYLSIDRVTVKATDAQQAEELIKAARINGWSFTDLHLEHLADA